jgi:hypothetical protein
MKPIAALVLVLLLAATATFFWNSSDDAPEPMAPKPALRAAAPDEPEPEPPGPDPRADRLAAMGLEPSNEPPPPPPDAIEFAELPDAHRAEVVLGKVQAFADTLEERFPTAGVQMLDAECTSAPCILGFNYDAKAVVAAEGGARGFHQGVRAAFEETLGYPVTSMHIDEVDGGKQIWMFAVPQEVAKDDPIRNKLIETGHHRHAILLGEDTGGEGDEGSIPGPDRTEE